MSTPQPFVALSLLFVGGYFYNNREGFISIIMFCKPTTNILYALIICYTHLIILTQFEITMFSTSMRSAHRLGVTAGQRWATARRTNNVQRILSMQLNCGIVGLPNVGKSTLFNALVGSEAAQAANFPFCTIGKRGSTTFLLLFCSFNMTNMLFDIEPNVGLVNVPDKRLVRLGEINKSEKLQHAVVSIT